MTAALVWVMGFRQKEERRRLTNSGSKVSAGKET